MPSSPQPPSLPRVRYDPQRAFLTIVKMREFLSTSTLLMLLKSLKFVNYYFPATSLLVKV